MRSPTTVFTKYYKIKLKVNVESQGSFLAVLWAENCEGYFGFSMEFESLQSHQHIIWLLSIGQVRPLLAEQHNFLLRQQCEQWFQIGELDIGLLWVISSRYIKLVKTTRSRPNSSQWGLKTWCDDVCQRRNQTKMPVSDQHITTTMADMGMGSSLQLGAWLLMRYCKQRSFKNKSKTIIRKCQLCCRIRRPGKPPHWHVVWQPQPYFCCHSWGWTWAEPALPSPHPAFGKQELFAAAFTHIHRVPRTFLCCTEDPSVLQTTSSSCLLTTVCFHQSLVCWKPVLILLLSLSL